MAEVYLGFFLKGNSLSDVLALDTVSILLFNLLLWAVERMTKLWTFYRNPRKERNELKFVELKYFFTIYLNICIGLCRTMERVNQTSSVSEFILLGLSSLPEDQKLLFALFFIMYVVTIALLSSAPFWPSALTLSFRHPCIFSLAFYPLLMFATQPP